MIGVASNLHNTVLKINEATFLLILIYLLLSILVKIWQSYRKNNKWVVLTGYSLHLTLIYPPMTKSLHTQAI